MRSLSSLLFIILSACTSKNEVVEIKNIKEEKAIEEPKQTEVIEKLMPQVSGLGELTNGQFVTYCAGVWVENNLMLTAAHCVNTPNNSQVKIINYEENLNPQKYFDGKVIKIDKSKDLAMIECSEGIHSVSKISKDKDKVGTKLHIIGHTKGLNWSYIDGWISAYRFMKAKNSSRIFTQVTAPIYYGDSGGGVFNEKGELIGITSFIYTIPNVAFAVTLDDIESFLKEFNNK